APKLRAALRKAKRRGMAYVIIDGTLIPIDRVAVDRPFYSGKHRRHGVNLQVIASPDGTILWVSGQLPGSTHDTAAARIWNILAALRDASLIALGDKGYHGYDETGRRLRHRFYTPFGVRSYPTSDMAAMRVGVSLGFLYALRREVLPNPIRLGGALSSDDTAALHARPHREPRVIVFSWRQAHCGCSRPRTREPLSIFTTPSPIGVSIRVPPSTACPVPGPRWPIAASLDRQPAYAGRIYAASVTGSIMDVSVRPCPTPSLHRRLDLDQATFSVYPST
ncbi:LOW QUALITY PROTEIN: transposase, partial [Kutzneria sp. 744]